MKLIYKWYMILFLQPTKKLMEDAGNMLLFSIAHLNLSRLSLIQDDVLVRNLPGKLRSSSAEVSQFALGQGEKPITKIWGVS